MRRPAHPRGYRAFVVVALGMAVEQAYEAFGLYLPRFLSDQAIGVVYNGVGEGLRKLAACAVATHDIRDWSSDAPWMTGAPSRGLTRLA